MLHDNVTEVTRKMYLTSDYSECIFDGWSFPAGGGNSHFTAKRVTSVSNELDCHQHCMEHSECVMFQYSKKSLICYLRKERIARNVNPDYVAGYKLCGSLYYEGKSNGGNQLTTVTFAKNLESAAIATADGVFRMKRCNENRGLDCFVLIQYL